MNHMWPGLFPFWIAWSRSVSELWGGALDLDRFWQPLARRPAAPAPAAAPDPVDVAVAEQLLCAVQRD